MKGVKSILFITNSYPINIGDAAFIKSEMPILARKFETLHVACNSILHKDSDVLDFPDNVRVYYRNWPDSESLLAKYSAKLGSIFSQAFLWEIFFLVKARKISMKRLLIAYRFVLDAIRFKRFIIQIWNSDEEIELIYTYWYSSETLAALFLKKKYGNIPVVTRAHGYDVHESENIDNYVPCKLWMDKKINNIFFASQHLHDYYLKKFAHCSPRKYVTMRLGTENTIFPSTAKINGRKDFFHICSCSYIIERKRIHLVIDALEKISDFDIHWTHIGDGPAGNDIRLLAYKSLFNKSNITYEFSGFFTNEQVMQFYGENHVDCFISSTEEEGGCPVSISEAISFGIPVIATNVGGIPEIVNSDFGFLLDVDSDSRTISNSIVDFYNLPEERKIAMRQAARLFWETNCKAESNHAKFTDELLAVVGEFRNGL